MTPNEVYQRVRSIAESSNNDRVAHCDEDELHRDVLQAIADGAEFPCLLATYALLTQEIDFSRWYA